MPNGSNNPISQKATNHTDVSVVDHTIFSMADVFGHFLIYKNNLWYFLKQEL